LPAPTTPTTPTSSPRPTTRLMCRRVSAGVSLVRPSHVKAPSLISTTALSAAAAAGLPPAGHVKRVCTIDISWLDWAKKNRLPVTSCIVDSAAIYIMVVKFRNTICPPQPQLSHHGRAALSSNSNGTSSYIEERTQSAVYTYCVMSMVCTNWWYGIYLVAIIKPPYIPVSSVGGSGTFWPDPSVGKVTKTVPTLKG
jgi:hypothetical protein